MQDLLKIIPGNVRETLKSAGPLVVTVILFILVGNFGISKVVDLRTQIAAAENDKEALTQKLSILQSFSEAPDSVNAAVIAMPKTNPSVTAISQLKSIAARDGIDLTTIKSGGGSATTPGLTYVTTTFQAGGSRDAILTFLKDVETIAPITQVTTVRISEAGGIATANVTTETYWAPYPSVIPSITQPITDLTNSEKQVLTQISGLIQPAFSDVTPSESGSVNSTPFGQ